MNMETYLRRTYAQKKSVEKDDFPFWDYRSRRGAFSSSNSSLTSSNSSCDGSSISSISSRSDTGSENISISEHSDTDSLLPCEQQKMTIQFLTDSHEISAMEEVYQPIINWIDPDLHVLKITDKSDSLDNAFTSLSDISARIPSMAVMVFLQEDGMVGFERIQTMKRYFEKSPWKFHHSEQVHRGAINPYPYNSQDFYYTSEDFPLWAVRQVHTGKEFFRTVLFVSESNWQSMMQFYKLILGCEPDVKREDFCLFTVSSFSNFNIQLALKKLQGDMKPRALDSVRLQFLVSDISNIVSLLPNVCRPLSDTRWETTDNDGNIVVLETPRIPSNSTFSDKCSISGRSSLSGRNSFGRQSSFSLNANSDEALVVNDRVNGRRSGRRGAKQNERSRSFIGDDNILQKIKMDNILYREKTIKAIKEKHVTLQVTGDPGHKENCTENNNMVDIKKPEPVKSFYV
ncbi:protein FAM124A-like [Mercenaria mercenaria]|uniref:protein FAM124A-like n=1 Tax=Mercenaria mercenaria TaxID=6596 RepID=UPI00234E6F1B|nr:protein FAM124A-like [Mercenaria mercenaria]